MKGDEGATNQDVFKYHDKLCQRLCTWRTNLIGWSKNRLHQCDRLSCPYLDLILNGLEMSRWQGTRKNWILEFFVARLFIYPVLFIAPLLEFSIKLTSNQPTIDYCEWLGRGSLRAIRRYWYSPKIFDISSDFLCQLFLNFERRPFEQMWILWTVI